MSHALEAHHAADSVQCSETGTINKHTPSMLLISSTWAQRSHQLKENLRNKKVSVEKLHKTRQSLTEQELDTSTEDEVNEYESQVLESCPDVVAPGLAETRQLSPFLQSSRECLEPGGLDTGHLTANTTCGNLQGQSVLSNTMNKVASFIGAEEQPKIRILQNNCCETNLHAMCPPQGDNHHLCLQSAVQRVKRRSTESTATTMYTPSLMNRCEHLTPPAAFSHEYKTMKDSRFDPNKDVDSDRITEAPALRLKHHEHIDPGINNVAAPSAECISAQSTVVDPAGRRDSAVPTRLAPCKVSNMSEIDLVEDLLQDLLSEQSWVLDRSNVPLLESQVLANGDPAQNTQLHSSTMRTEIIMDATQKNDCLSTLSSKAVEDFDATGCIVVLDNEQHEGHNILHHDYGKGGAGITSELTEFLVAKQLELRQVGKDLPEVVESSTSFLRLSPPPLKYARSRIKTRNILGEKGRVAIKELFSKT